MSGLPFPDLPYSTDGHSADYLLDDDEGFLLDDAENRCADCGDTLHHRDGSPYCVGCRMIQKADET